MGSVPCAPARDASWWIGVIGRLGWRPEGGAELFPGLGVDVCGCSVPFFRVFALSIMDSTQVSQLGLDDKKKAGFLES